MKRYLFAAAMLAGLSLGPLAASAESIGQGANDGYRRGNRLPGQSEALWAGRSGPASAGRSEA